MIPKLLICILPLATALPSVAQTESDFAPLAPGNTWKYRGQGGYAVSGVARHYTTWRTIRILTKTAAGDSTVYAAALHDSTQNIWGFDLTVKPDTAISNTTFAIVERNSGLVLRGETSVDPADAIMLKLCFRAHAYNSAEIENDTAMGNKVRVVKKTGSDTAYTLVRNTGLYYFKHQIGNPGAFPTEYTLSGYQAGGNSSLVPKRRLEPWAFRPDFLRGRDWLGKAETR